MVTTTTLAQLRVPLGGQEIALEQVEHVAGGMPLLRIRIRERNRFTIFDVDPQTAIQWGDAMRRWGEGQQGGAAVQP